MRLHRLPRINYPIRVASFAWCALVVGILLHERGAGAPAWGLLALSFLAYPHVAWLLARVTADSRGTELRNLYFDSVLLGAWVAALGFPVWIAYGGLLATTLNNTVM